MEYCKLNQITRINRNKMLYFNENSHTVLRTLSFWAISLDCCLRKYLKMNKFLNNSYFGVEMVLFANCTLLI